MKYGYASIDPEENEAVLELHKKKLIDQGMLESNIMNEIAITNIE
jgi:hypothetical protein